MPARLARTDFLPDRPPFEERFDLAFAYSVFTHISEEAHKRCLQVLYESLRPGGVLVVTVRPPEYLRLCERMHPVVEALGTDYLARLEEPRYLFVPHPAEERHLQYAGGDMSYGETVITLSYIRETWSHAFELLDVAPQVGDLHQVILTLRRQ